MMETVGAAVAADTLVIAFGDVAKLSPPVAFYLACVRAAFAVLGVRRVLLAFADRANPGVMAVEMALRARAIPVFCKCVGDGLWPDAAHLVVSGQAHPSPRLRSLFSFRDLDLLHAIGRAGAVKLFVGRDTAPGYPAAGAWKASLGQCAAMLSYAEADIVISEVTAPVVAAPAKPDPTIALVVQARTDDIHLIEWIAHHRAIGASEIFVYTDEHTDGSDALLAALAAEKRITLRHHGSEAPRHPAQMQSELRPFDWVLFLDADEFLVPDARHDHSIIALLAAAGDEPQGALQLPIDLRCWSRRFDRTPGMTLAGFPHAERSGNFKAMLHLPALDANVAIPAANPDIGASIQQFRHTSFVETALHRHSAALTEARSPTLANVRPIPSMIIARARAEMERLLAIPDIASAVAYREAQFTRRAAAIAADPAMRAAFAALPDALLPPPWTAEDVGRTEALLMGRDGAAVLADAFSTRFSDAPDRETLRQMLEALLDPGLPFLAVESSDPRATLWLDAIASSRAQRRGEVGRTVLELGTDYDFLAISSPPPTWTVWQWLGVLALRQIQPTRTVAAMVSTRNEGINLLEWVAHYQAIGVERIFVYTNANDDGSDTLLTALAKHDIITLVMQHCGTGVWAQRRALQHSLLMLPELRQFTWVLFPDADEYAVPDARYGYRIAPLLAAADALPSRPGAILLPWRMRLWPHRFDRPPGMTLANYPHAMVHELFKSAVRPAVATSMIEIHFPNLDPGVTLVDSSFAEVPADARWSSEPKSDAGGRVEHVWARSFTDFIIKRQRGFTGGFRHFDLFHKFNLAMTPENLWPVEPVVIARTQEKLAALRAIPEIAAAADQIEAIYAARAAEIAADPELQAIFAAQPNPNGDQVG